MVSITWKSILFLSISPAISFAETPSELDYSQTSSKKSLSSSLFPESISGNEDELNTFYSDIGALLKSSGLTPQDSVNRNFSKLAILFSNKYKSSFPVGSLRKKIIDGVHIEPGCKHSFMNEPSVSAIISPYLILSQNILSEAKIVSDKNVCSNLTKIAFILNVECGYPDMDVVANINSAYGGSAKRRIWIGDEKRLSECKKEFDFNSNLVSVSKNKMLKMMDKIQRTLKNRPLSDVEINDIIGSFLDIDKAAKSNQADDVLYYSYIRRIWDLKNMALIAKDSKLLEAVLVLLKKKSEDMASLEETRRWAKEALSCEQQHVPIRFFRAPLISGPNGWGVDESDGKPPHPYDPKDYE